MRTVLTDLHSSVEWVDNVYNEKRKADMDGMLYMGKWLHWTGFLFGCVIKGINMYRFYNVRVWGNVYGWVTEWRWSLYTFCLIFLLYGIQFMIWNKDVRRY